MSLKDEIIALINSAYRHDKFIGDFTDAISIVFNRLIAICESIRNNTFFDSLDEYGVSWWEKHLNIIPNASQTLSDRSSSIQAKYLSSSHNSIKLLQSLCDAWKNGEVEVDFIDGKFEFKFVGAYGVPVDLDSLKEAVDETKPAHIGVSYIFKYLFIEDIHNVKTLEELESITIEEFALGKDE
ncbi:MAG: DUF2313 domain-containing protein [Clostridia bacterium]|nr:DUF2313 domain-containing protein [Clostridia bacterium]